LSNIGNPPCDVGVIHSRNADALCEETSRPWVLAATIMGSAMAFMDSTVTNVALPQIQDRLGAPAADSQWVVESYALFSSALILVGGSLWDHFGRRRIFSLGIVVFTLASVWSMFVAAGLAVASAVAAALIMEGKGSTAQTKRTGRPEGETVPA
jgi:MFS family permease